MGIVQAFRGALGATLADQWQDIITAGAFSEDTVVAPGVYQQTNNGRGSNFGGSADIISNGSKIFVPENTAAFIFSQAGIEEIVTQPGGYEYRNGQPSIFNGDGFTASLAQPAFDSFRFGGQPSGQKYVSFVNLREIRGLKFGTRGPMVYHDRFYQADLELTAFGTFSLRVVDAVAFVRNFLPANTRHYAFSSPEARRQISSEFMQALIVAVNALSAAYRISELPAHAGEISRAISDDGAALGSWIVRYGLDVVDVGIESIELSPESRDLVKRFAATRMKLGAFEGISQQASNVSAQQNISQGIRDHGLTNASGAIFGIGLAQSISPQTAAPVDRGTPPATPSLDDQIEAVKKLKELLDAGILSQDEFDTKKKQVMGL